MYEHLHSLTHTDARTHIDNSIHKRTHGWLCCCHTMPLWRCFSTSVIFCFSLTAKQPSKMTVVESETNKHSRPMNCVRESGDAQTPILSSSVTKTLTFSQRLKFVTWHYVGVIVGSIHWLLRILLSILYTLFDMCTTHTCTRSYAPIHRCHVNKCPRIFVCTVFGWTAHCHRLDMFR